jgi:hypothetical protein
VNVAAHDAAGGGVRSGLEQHGPNRFLVLNRSRRIRDNPNNAKISVNSPVNL